MGTRLIIDKEEDLIILLSSKNQWENKTNNITAIYAKNNRGYFQGYDVYFVNSSKKYFYGRNRLLWLKRIKEIPVNNRAVFIDGKMVQATEIIYFGHNYYRIKVNGKNIVTNNFKIVEKDHKNIMDYYLALAKYAEGIANNDEPLFFLAKNFHKMTLSTDSVLLSYLQGILKKERRDNLIILPFDFNQSQYLAVEKALINNISIIEGPPGTGKTQTILNLIANILIQNKSCAVISNNNSAVMNIQDKLVEEGLSFLSANLGSLANVGRFFEEINHQELDDFLKKEAPKIKADVNQLMMALTSTMKKVQEKEVALMRFTNEKLEIEIEQKLHIQRYGKYVTYHNRMTSSECVQLIQKFESPKKMRWWEKLKIRLKYKIKINWQDINRLLVKLESAFYQLRVKEINQSILEIETFLKKNKKDEIMIQLKLLSKNIWLNRLKNHFQKIEEVDFNEKTYKYDYSNFLKRFPVLLSTTHSLINNIPQQFKFDYLIIDESSQSDLLSSVLAMSCAKNIVVVGDSRQLQQIEEECLFLESEKLAEKYHVPSSYQYEKNSILTSIIESIPDVPITLLKEHYRSAPDIINFCNKMFYNNELIPMTKNNGRHLQIIKTVPGNHARRNPYGKGLYNQREIDEIIELTKGKNLDRIGVITPFRYQANLIQNAFNDTALEADTVHKYQGRQKDEIILSFVANSLELKEDELENRFYDFITNEKLLNVAISRGKTRVTAIVSDKVYHSKQNIIRDFIDYVHYVYGDKATKESTITSVFDSLYEEHRELLLKKFAHRKNEHKSELLMTELIQDALKNYPRIGYQMHVRLSKIVDDLPQFNLDERKYLLHPSTHVDYLFYHKVTKERLFVLEVDGIRFHEQKEDQTKRDELKNKALKLSNIPIYRFKTNEAREKERIFQVFNTFSY